MSQVSRTGPGDGPFCACPSGFECQHLVDLGVGSAELAGSYCVRAGTYVPDPSAIADGPTCDRELGNCEGR